jgi:hypothetical protein
MTGFTRGAAHPRRQGIAALAADRGDALLAWVVKIAVVLGLIGVVAFDGISIGSTSVTIADQGSAAALQASEAWQQNHDLQKTYDAAVLAAKEQNVANTVATKDFRIDPDGTVHLTLSRTATTVVVRRIGPAKHWALVSHSAQGRSVG